jgi:hypothetical protein
MSQERCHRELVDFIEIAGPALVMCQGRLSNTRQDALAFLKQLAFRGDFAIMLARWIFSENRYFYGRRKNI